MLKLQWIMLAGVGLFIASAGCKTDAVWRESAPPGPIAVLKSSPQTAADIQTIDRKEVDLVEAVLADRTSYLENLLRLEEFYEQHGNETKRQWAAYELEGLHRQRHYRYILDAEIPSESLRPIDTVSEADSMFADAMRLMQQGGHSLPVVYREDKMLEAVDVLVRLIETYPTSDKIDDAAFYLGEIHKEYFKNQELLAVKWYERALAWNPQTPHPVRFQAAVVYDFRLHDRKRAMELYQQVLTQETGNRSNLNFATRRIAQLTEEPMAVSNVGEVASRDGMRDGMNRSPADSVVTEP